MSLYDRRCEFSIYASSENYRIINAGVIALGKYDLLSRDVHRILHLFERLNQGELLTKQDLCDEYSVGDKTVQRDIQDLRYYLNIVGKYGMQVQTVLKKAAQIDIDMICPLHGPVLKEDLSQYICAYQTWSQYLPEESGILLAYASIHGYTKDVVMYLADLLKKQGENIELVDLCREDVSYAVAKAFKYDRMILASSTYDGSMFCPMETFLHHLKSKNFQKRTIGLIENGSWAPMANKAMKSLLETMKDIEIVEPTITVRSSLSEENKKELEELVKTMVEGGCQDEVCM